MSESLNSNQTWKNLTPLTSEEDLWLTTYVPNHTSRANLKSPQKERWEIRMEDLEFIKWRSSLEEHCLFFDGASKGNLDPAGGGGVLMDPLGKVELSYAWGLGTDSNNHAQILALW